MTFDARQNLEKDPWGTKDYGNSVSSSPRSKATRVSYAQSEYSIMVAFVKNNLPLFLRLVSSDIHNKEVQLSGTEFNTLRVLFKLQGTDGRQREFARPGSASSSGVQPIKPLTSVAPFFFMPNNAKGGASPKVHMGVITEWINSLLVAVEPSEGLFKLNSLNKCVATKSHAEIFPLYGNSCKMSITGCEESNIYIDSNIETLLI